MPNDNDKPAIAAGADPMKALRDRLQDCVRELDRLERHHPAALICMAIDRLGQTSADPASSA